jgi:hypothetical protein
MMDDERVNLSALDPARDPGRWRAVMETTMTRVDGVLLHRARPDPLVLIADWRRPLLAIAAAAVLLLVPVEVALERRESREQTLRGLVDVSTAWAQEGRAPTGAELLHAVRAGGAR